MFSRQLGWLGTAAALSLLSACGSTSEASTEAEDVPALYTQTLSLGSARFILSRAEQQQGDDIVLFDHQCTSGRITMSVRDTIILNSNGALERSYNLRQSMAGVVSDSPNQMPGTWRLNPNWRRSGRSGVSLLYQNANPRASGETEMWLVDVNTLVLPGSMGGSCPGSPNDGRNADMIYTRR